MPTIQQHSRTANGASERAEAKRRTKAADKITIKPGLNPAAPVAPFRSFTKETEIFANAIERNIPRQNPS